MDCVSCGSVLPEGSTFCNVCGAAQATITPGERPQDSVEPPAASSPTTAREAPSAAPRNGSSKWIALTLVALLLIAGGVGVAWKVSSDNAAAAEASARATKAAATAKADAAEASKVMTSVEKCESAVTVGVTLDDLTALATTAQQDVQAFSRTDAAQRMPEFEAAIAAAAQSYQDSCRHWFDANKAATKKYDAAVHTWIYGNGKEPKSIDQFRDDSAYQADWTAATLSMEGARAAFKKDTAAPPSL
jgi:hypothetical protein